MFQRDRIDSLLNKYSKKDGGPVHEVIYQTKMIKDVNKTQPYKTIAETAKTIKTKSGIIKKIKNGKHLKTKK